MACGQGLHSGRGREKVWGWALEAPTEMVRWPGVMFSNLHIWDSSSRWETGTGGGWQAGRTVISVDSEVDVAFPQNYLIVNENRKLHTNQ